jgi:hypothetical protein
MAVQMNCVTSLFRVTFEATHLQMPFALEMLCESLITGVRNLLVLKFLADESDVDLYWIDSDIEFRAASVFRLLCADRDVAAGVYPLKIPIGHGAERIGPYADSDGFIEVDEAPAGFMVIKRETFLAVMKHYPRLNYTPDRPAGYPRDPSALALFRHHGRSPVGTFPLPGLRASISSRASMPKGACNLNAAQPRPR